MKDQNFMQSALKLITVKNIAESYLSIQKDAKKWRLENAISFDT